MLVSKIKHINISCHKQKYESSKPIVKLLALSLRLISLDAKKDQLNVVKTDESEKINNTIQYCVKCSQDKSLRHSTVAPTPTPYLFSGISPSSN